MEYRDDIPNEVIDEANEKQAKQDRLEEFMKCVEHLGVEHISESIELMNHIAGLQNKEKMNTCK